MKPKFSKLVVLAVLISVAVFTIAMTIIYIQTGGIPDTLVTAYFAFAGGEAGCLGLIRCSKAKHQTDSTNDTPTDDAVG